MMLDPYLIQCSSRTHPNRGLNAFSPALISGFLPAFRHEESGEVHLCQFSDGIIAPVHSLDHLPSHWVTERDPAGRPVALVPAIAAGYLRGHEFWSLGDIKTPCLDG